MFNKIKTQNLLYSLFALTLIEFLSFTFLPRFLGSINCVLLLFSGILSSIIAYNLYNRLDIRGSMNLKFENNNKYLNHLIFFVLSVVLIIMSSYIFKEFPIDANASDIVPSLQIYIERFFNGEFPYSPIQFSSWTVYPNYFVLRWIPFIIPEFLHIDYRFLPLVLFLGLIWIIRIKDKVQKFDALYYITYLLPYFLLFLILKFQKDEFALSAELLIVFYYFIFIISLKNRKTYIVAFGISLCLLSRYTILYWLLFYFLFYAKEYGNRKFIKLLGLISLFFGLAMGHFFIIDFKASFLEGLKYYEESARGLWNVQYWQEANDIPHHLGKGMNFSIGSYKAFYPNINAAFYFQKYLQLALLFLLIIAFAVIKVKKENQFFYLLISIKIYLLVFYQFFYAPFSYLLFLPLFITFLMYYYLFVDKKWCKFLQ